MDVMQIEIRQFVIDNFLFGQDRAFANSESLLENGIIDSTGVLELIAFLESRYSISIADAELLPENLDSVDRVATFVERKRRQQGVRPQ